MRNLMRILNLLSLKSVNSRVKDTFTYKLMEKLPQKEFSTGGRIPSWQHNRAAAPNQQPLGLCQAPAASRHCGVKIAEMRNSRERGELGRDVLEQSRKRRNVACSSDLVEDPEEETSPNISVSSSCSVWSWNFGTWASIFQLKIKIFSFMTPTIFYNMPRL